MTRHSALGCRQARALQAHAAILRSGHFAARKNPVGPAAFVAERCACPEDPLEGRNWRGLECSVGAPTSAARRSATRLPDPRSLPLHHARRAGRRTFSIESSGHSAGFRALRYVSLPNRRILDQSRGEFKRTQRAGAAVSRAASTTLELRLICGRRATGSNTKVPAKAEVGDLFINHVLKWASKLAP